MRTARLEVQGMTCGHCVAAVEKALRGQAGVRNASVDLQAGAAEVEYDEASIALEQLIAAIQDEGYSASVARA
jgi:copper chaperone